MPQGTSLIVIVITGPVLHLSFVNSFCPFQPFEFVFHFSLVIIRLDATAKRLVTLHNTCAGYSGHWEISLSTPGGVQYSGGYHDECRLIS